MFSSPAARKFTRVAVATAVTGATAAFLLLGAPADAATFVSAASRGI